jgi:hypothetical protein
VHNEQARLFIQEDCTLRIFLSRKREYIWSETVRRRDVFLGDLDPTKGGESQTTRPCLVVSLDQLNAYLRTFTVAALD